jgi:hypothetical protein
LHLLLCHLNLQVELISIIGQIGIGCINVGPLCSSVVEPGGNDGLVNLKLIRLWGKVHEGSVYMKTACREPPALMAAKLTLYFTAGITKSRRRSSKDRPALVTERLAVKTATKPSSRLM